MCLSIDVVVDFEVDSEELVSRLTGRSTCSDCGAMFHRTSCPPLRVVYVIVAKGSSTNARMIRRRHYQETVGGLRA